MRTPQITIGNDFVNISIFKGKQEQRDLKVFASDEYKYDNPHGTWQEMRIIAQPFGSKDSDSWQELARVGYTPPFPFNVLGHVPAQPINVRPLVDSSY